MKRGLDSQPCAGQRGEWFEPNGREPELPGHDADQAPMLGGQRRLWPSVSAYLLAEQHRAHRRGNMERVWIIRRLRTRIQIRMLLAREESWYTGQPVPPLTDRDAVADMIAEREEILEELAQARQGLRLLRAAEHQRAFNIVSEYIEYWKPRVDGQGS